MGDERPDGSMRAPVVRPPVATIEGEGAEVVEGSTRRVVGHLAGSNPYLEAATERERMGGPVGGAADGLGARSSAVVSRPTRVGGGGRGWVAAGGG